MKRLIDSAFLHVDVLGPHVQAGHFDLMTSSPSAPGNASNMASMTFAGVSQQTVGVPVHQTTMVAPGAASPSSFSSASSTTSSPEAPEGLATGGSTEQSAQFIILPDIWEDMIEPGSKLDLDSIPGPHSSAFSGVILPNFRTSDV